MPVPSRARCPLLVRRRAPWTRRASLAVSVSAAAALCLRSVWPSAMVIRAVFHRGGRKTAAAMRREMVDLIGPVPVRSRRVVLPPGGGPRCTLEVFAPLATESAAATIVWIHGGAWISGSTSDVAPYLRLLATHGFTVIGVGYSVAPRRRYPTAVHQINEALAHLLAHAEELGVDPTRIVLAGDSAGAQLASQMAVLIKDPSYAGALGVRPGLEPEALVGAVLHCGVYDLAAMTRLSGLPKWGFGVALWAYSGSRAWADTAAGHQMSVIRHAEPSFPPTLISGGNADGLTPLQSRAFADRLRELAVPVTDIFWPDDHTPALGHEYQFMLALPEARVVFERTLSFLSGLGEPVHAVRGAPCQRPAGSLGSASASAG